MTVFNNFSLPEAAIFDMDGTLFETETLLLPAYHQTFKQLRKEGLYTGETPPENIILSCLGMLLEDIWKQVVPGGTEQMKERANQLLLQYQLEGLQEGKGELYPGVLDTLRNLRGKGVQLFVASNGLEEYVKGIVQAKKMESYFNGVYSAGEYNTSSKVELVKLLLKNHRIQSAWMVGDRSSDVEAGKENGLLVIGCQYASFGQASELDGADVIINTFAMLSDLGN